MLLESFFTPAEVKDGISTPFRIEELIREIQKPEGCVRSTIDDSIRAWSAVVSTLASTKNKECLKHFLQLDGLCILDQWLQEAQKFCDDALTDDAAHLINALLTLLEHLPINNEHSNSSALGATVAQLFVHGMVEIKGKARMLCQNWSRADNGETDEALVNLSNFQSYVRKLERPNLWGKMTADITARDGPQGQGDEIQTVAESRCSDSAQIKSSNNAKLCASNEDASLRSNNENVVSNDARSSILSLVSHAYLNNVSFKADTLAFYEAMVVSSVTCSAKFNGLKNKTQHALPQDVPVAVEGRNGKSFGDIPCINGERERCIMSDTKSSSVPKQTTTDEQTIPGTLHFKKSDRRASLTLEPQMDDGLDCRMQEGFQTKEEPSQVACDFQNKTSEHGNKECHVTSQKEKISSIGSNTDGSFGDASLKETKAAGTKATVIKENLELVMEDDDLDAPEAAQQVAIEDEKQVVDNTEGFCCSSEVYGGDERGIDTPHFEEFKQKQPAIEHISEEKSPVGTNCSRSTSLKEHCSIITEKTSSASGEHKPDSNSTTAQELLCKSDSNSNGLDLNVACRTEELDYLTKPLVNVNATTPIVVAASRGSLVLPVIPIHFEGELGWKGTAATSAFRRPCPWQCRSNEQECSSPQKKLKYQGIDLNVVESEVVAEPVPVTANRPSRDSFVASTSRGLGNHNWDLNCSMKEDAPSLFMMHHLQIGDHSLSSASSLSSKLPALRDFDLNDEPLVTYYGASHVVEELSFRAVDACVEVKTEESFITIMGSKIALAGEENPRQMLLPFLSNDPNTEAACSAGSVLPSSNMPTTSYGVTGLATESATSSYDECSSLQSNLDLNDGTRPMFLQGHSVVNEHARNASRPSNSRAAPKRKEHGCS